VTDPTTEETVIDGAPAEQPVAGEVASEPGNAPEGRRRGRVSLYAAAFALMLAAGTVLVVTSLGSLQSTRLLWVSAGLSIAAIIVSVASLVAPRR
jgi:hypothetical protein